jgi:hypothetical protein
MIPHVSLGIPGSLPVSPLLKSGIRGYMAGCPQSGGILTTSTAHKNNTASGLLPGGAHPHVVAVGVHHGFRVDSDGKRLFKPLGIAPKQLNTFANSQRICLLDAYFLASTASISTVASTVATTVNTRRKP